MKVTTEFDTRIRNAGNDVYGRPWAPVELYIVDELIVFFLPVAIFRKCIRPSDYLIYTDVLKRIINAAVVEFHCVCLRFEFAHVRSVFRLIIHGGI